MAPLWEDGRGEGVCPICQELPKGAVSTDCGHLFCRGCLAQHVAKASASGVLCCPLCRKPCSEGVLGAAHLCPRHQKKVSYFCEESRRLLCAQCLGSPEHQGHRELAIESAVSHYKVRPGTGCPSGCLLPSAHTAQGRTRPISSASPCFGPCPDFPTCPVLQLLVSVP